MVPVVGSRGSAIGVAILRVDYDGGSLQLFWKTLTCTLALLSAGWDGVVAFVVSRDRPIDEPIDDLATDISIGLQ